MMPDPSPDPTPVVETFPEDDQRRIKLELEAAETYLAYKQTYTGDAGLAAAALLLAYLMWHRVGPGIILSWLAVELVVNLGNLLLVWRFYTIRPDWEAVRRWRRFWYAGMILDSATWGVGGVLLFPVATHYHQMVLGLVYLGIGLAIVAAYSAVRWVPAISVSLTTIPLSVRFLLAPGEVDRILGLLLLIYIGVMVYFSRNLYHASRRASLASIENIRLARNLSTELEERKAVEVAQRESEEKFRFLVENALDGIILVREGKIIYANNAARRLGGLPDDFEDVLAYDAFSPDDFTKSLLRDWYQGHLEGREMPKQFETRVQRRDGSVVDVLVSSTVVHTGGVPRTIAIIKDMSEFKQIELLKREFVAIVSHELRTPLTSILASLQMVSEGMTGDLEDDTINMVEIAQRNTSRLIRLADSLLEAHRLDFGLEDFHKIDLDLNRLVSSAVENSLPQFREAGLELKVMHADNSSHIHGDHEALLHVMANLLSNAAKFSPPGGQVEVRVAAHPSVIRVEVADQGPGIPPEFRHRVFEKFARSKESAKINPDGTGLGLNIAKSIVEAHEGTIGFNHNHPTGVTFFFEIPRS